MGPIVISGMIAYVVFFLFLSRGFCALVHCSFICLPLDAYVNEYWKRIEEEMPCLVLLGCPAVVDGVESG